MVAQFKLRCHSVCSFAQLHVMRFVADALGYGAGQPIGGAGMSVGKMAVDALVEPLRDAAHTECRCRKRMQTCFGSGQPERLGPNTRDYQQITAVESRGQICRIQPWVENNLHAGIMVHDVVRQFFPSWSRWTVANEIELNLPPNQ